MKPRRLVLLFVVTIIVRYSTPKTNTSIDRVASIELDLYQG